MIHKPKLLTDFYKRNGINPEDPTQAKIRTLQKDLGPPFPLHHDEATRLEALEESWLLLHGHPIISKPKEQ